MTGKEATLEEFFFSTDPIVIPVYQRNYTWKKSDCKTLLDDIVNIANQADKTHFIGSIVHVKHSDANIIIDGQQRITTISILLLAIRNAIENGDIATENEMLSQEIEEKFLINKFTKQKERRMKLKPFRDDCKAFDALFGPEKDFVGESKITENYRFFYSELISRKLDPQAIFDAIKKRLEFVRITLEPSHGDDAQQIFESINSTGVRLTETDKIRNYVLMNLDANTQEKYYNEFWFPIEKDTDIYLEDFMRDYLTMTRRSIPNKSEVYRVFKEFVADNYPNDIAPLLESLKKYAAIFKSVKDCNVGSEQANKTMHNLEQLEITTTYPFLLAMLNHHTEGGIDDAELEKVLQILEVFLFRRIMSGYYNTGLNKVFHNMHYRIMKMIRDDYTYSDVFVYLLQHGISYWVFPDDAEFKRSFEEREVYKMRSNYRLYLFCSLEESLNKEAIGTMKKIEDGVLSIEHIMPQTLTDEWRYELGEDFTEEDFNKWIHNIGNLTLTAYNSEYSNRKFIEKRDGIPSLPDMKGFKDSCVAMNKYVSQCDHWTKAEMEERCQLLYAQAVKLWPFPTTDFKPLVVEDELIPIDAEYAFKGRYIKSYVFDGTSVNVESWADAFTRIAKTLYEKDSSILYHLANDPSEVYYSSKQEKSYNKVADGIYILVGCDTNNKIRQIHRLLSMYKLDSDDIAVTLYPRKELSANE